LDVFFTNNSEPASVYEWTTGDGNEFQTTNFQHTYFNNSTQSITYTLVLSAMNEYGCGSTDTAYVTAYPGATAMFEQVNNPSDCGPFTAHFVNQSSNAVSYLWNLGDGTTSNLVSPTHTYTNNTGVLQFFDVTLIAYNQNGCNDTITQQLLVFPVADMDFTITGVEGCSPLTVTMPYVNGIQDFQWDFGDGSTSTYATPTHTYINNGESIEYFTITLIGTSAFGCVDTGTTTIPVYPAPIAQYEVNQAAGCGPLEVLFRNLSINANQFTWDYGDGSTSTNADISHAHLYDHNSTSVQSYVATLIATNSEGCSSEYSSVIQVYPQVTAAFVDPDSLCAPANLSLTNASTNASTYQWNFGNALQSVASNPSTFYANATANPITFDIQLIATSIYNCADTVVHDVVILPQALAQFSTDVISGCSPVTVSITNQSQNADILTWTYGDGTNSTETAAVHTHDYVNNSFVADEYPITLSVQTEYGCASNYTSSVLIYPGMSANFTPPANYCSPASVGFANTSVNAISYQWDFGNGSISALPSPTAFFQNETEDPISFDVTLIATSSFGCVDSITQSITINPTPVASFALSALSGCAPLDVVIDNNTVRADALIWNFGDGVTSNTMDTTIAHTYYNNGNTPLNLTIQLLATTNEGCSSQQAQNITVYPTVVANFGEPGVYCSPANVSFVNSSFNAVSYQWDFGNGLFSVMQNPNSFYINQSGDSQVLDVSLIAASAFGCLDTMVRTITIHSTPVAAFSPSITGGCSPLVVDFDQNTVAADAITWSFGDGFTENTLDTLVQHTYYNLTNEVVEYNVLMTASDDAGCSAQATTVIQVYPLIQASFGDPGQHCSPVNVSFFNTSTPGTTYFWDFDNGVQSVMQNPTVFFVNNADTVAVFDITLTATSAFGCTMMATYPMSVHPAPTAEFVMGENAACAPAPIPFYNLSDQASSYYWSYGDGTSSTTSDSIHVHDFLDLGNGSAQYQISLTAITDFGCTDTAQAYFTLYPTVNASFLVDTIGCSPFNTQFINQSAGAVSYQWVFGDAQTSSAHSPSHVYTAGFEEDETYQAMLIAYSVYGCADTLEREVVAQHTPQSVIQVDSMYGCNPTSVVFNNLSIGADQYLWNYGTGQTSTTAEPVHAFDFLNVTTGLYTFQVTLTASTDGGCSNSSFVNVEIPPQLIASFASIEEGCSPLDVTFDNLTQGGTDYAWSFGDDSFSNAFEPQHSFTNWTNSDTTFVVQLITQNTFGCADTTQSIITVFGNPLAGFEVTPQTQVWPNATVELQNTTIGGSLGYTWNMGNGFALFDQNPAPYAYETWGEYSIQLIVSNGSCADTAFRIIEIIPPAATANFEGPAEGCAPLTVQFTNLSEYAVASNWNFGDGGQSNSTNPVYTFWQAGTYTISLTVVGPDGQSDQMVQEQIIVVHPRAQAAFVVTPSDVDVPGEAVFCLNLSNFAVSYAWDFGDGNTSAEENPQHYYQAAGEYDVTLIATSAFGCSDTLKLVGVVSADASGKIEFPNAFSPSTTGGSNGAYNVNSLDNDVFFPIHNGIDTYELLIFNKWGELLFKSTDVLKGWDGYYRGVLAPQDVYVWKVSGTFVDGRAFQDSGDVTLIVK
jgi:PKD repeat protein